MDDVILYSLLVRLAVAAIALGTLFWFLRLLDARAGLDWKGEVIPTLERDPRALADYLGKRWLGACVVLGLLLS